MKTSGKKEQNYAHTAWIYCYYELTHASSLYLHLDDGTLFNCLYITEAIADDADVDFFCKMANHRYCVHSLLSPIKSCNHYLRPKGHIYELPDVTLRCIKSHLYNVVFISTCNVLKSFSCSFLSLYCIHRKSRCFQ